MNGISDSLASLSSAPPVCPSCGATARINGGECLSCLLRVGVDSAAPEVDLLSQDSTPNLFRESTDNAQQDLDALLAEIDIRDNDWRLGNYQILEEVGRGGMGVIYRARQRHSKRIVALKRVLSYHGDSRETLQRFRREAEAAASLDHPNILPIYEVSEDDGLPFFTMKFATAGSLQQAAPALSADPRECVRLLAKVTRAVAFAHRAGILHRDLKPGNILLDGRGEPLVSDFGLAKWIDASSDLTRSLTIFGTPGYIAPEQASGSPTALTPAADVYSLGAILFDLLTGRPPFLGEHALAVIRQAAEKPAPKLRSIIQSDDRDLEIICAKCLERDPRARYGSARDLAEDLDRWLEGRAIVARPVLPPTRVWRWAKRNPVLACTAALCLIIGALALTRQMHGWRLEKEINTRIATQHSIRVLPLLDLDSAQVSEELAAELGAALEQNLKLMGPAKVMFSSPVGTSGDSATPPTHSSDVPARAFLSGTTRIANGQRRISVHLLEANSQTPLLHELIDTDPAGAPSVAARQIAGRVYEILSAADLRNAGPPTVDPGLLDPEAKSFIDQGLELANRRGGLDIDRSIACLKHAIELRPGSAAAHAALAKALAFEAAYESSREQLAKGLQHARKAVELDPANSEAHLGLAALLYQYGRMKESINEALIALEYSPIARRAGNLLANSYRAIGRPDEALLWFHVGEEHKQERLRAHWGVADCWAALGDDEQAEAAYSRSLKLHPEQPEGWMGICRLRLWNGRIEEARAIYQAETKGYRDFAYARQMAAQVEFFARNFAEAEKLYAELYQRDPNGGASFYGAITYASALGRIKLEYDAVAGRKLLEQARQAETELVHPEQERADPFYRLAAIEASLGARESALQSLERAVAAGWIDYRSPSIDPRFDSIREDELFKKHLSTMAARVAKLEPPVPLDPATAVRRK
jgi:serine/threonine protein kinase/tetratricopeptide (TPR) repeat protein